MTDVKFSYKKAIAHGWAKTKKFLTTILLLAAVYFLITGTDMLLKYFAGSGNIYRLDVSKVYKDKTQADALYQYLLESGYIDQLGAVQVKLQQTSSVAFLILPPEFQEDQIKIFDFLNQYRYRLPFSKPVYYVLAVLFWVVSMLVSIGLLKANLMMSRNEKPSISELFSNGHLFIPFVLGGLCYGLAVIGGIILLIVPGLILMFMLQMYPYLIVDKGMGPIASLKHSRVITKGSRGRLAIFGLLLLLLNLTGLLCLVVGLFFTLSISSIAMAYVYDRLENPVGEGAVTPITV